MQVPTADIDMDLKPTYIIQVYKDSNGNFFAGVEVHREKCKTLFYTNTYTVLEEVTKEAWGHIRAGV